MREEVGRRYAAAALYVWEGGESSCSGGSGVSEALREVPLASAFVRARKPVD